MDQAASGPTEPRLKLPILGEVTIEDIVVVLAAGTGAIITLAALALAGRL